MNTFKNELAIQAKIEHYSSLPHEEKMNFILKLIERYGLEGFWDAIGDNKDIKYDVYNFYLDRCNALGRNPFTGFNKNKTNRNEKE